MQPLRNVMVPTRSLTLATDVQDDLPVNPLYMIYYTLRGEQLAGSGTTDAIPSLANLLSVVPRIEVLFRGTTIVSGSLQDIAVMNALFCGRLPWIIHQGDATNNAVAVTVPIYLGRPWLMGVESYPATRRGELTLRRVFNTASTNLVTTTLSEQIETLEMLGGEPPSFLKYVTIAKTFLTTGDNDVDFPLGNRLLGALLFGTTGFTATTDVATWKTLKMLVDGVEWTYALTEWETLQGELAQYIDRDSELQAHVHTENLAAMYAADGLTTIPGVSEAILNHYGFLNFDMWRDEKYVLDTQGRGRAWLRATAGTADAARMLPLEIVDLQPKAAAAAA